MYEYRAKLDRIIDGDTIDVIIDLGFDIKVKHRLRIRGVDAEELRSSDPDEKIKAQAAKQFVFECLENRDLTVKTFKTKSGRDRKTFGRYVADVLFTRDVDGKKVTLDLGTQLIKEGHAKSFK